MFIKAATAVVLCLLLSVPALGQGKSGRGHKTVKASPAATSGGFTQHMVDTSNPKLIYKGVTLYGGGDPPEFKPPPVGIKYVTWPGFHLTKTGSEIFLQISGPVVPKRKDRGRRIFITLDSTKVPFKNNLRAVITKHFPTPVKSFKLRRLRGNKLRLEISLQRRTTARVQTRSSGAYTYLVVSFPKKTKKARRRK